MTNVGEHGVMLSGGQKARVALARAIYQDKDIYLIDDIFSSLDLPVGLQIFRKCINGLLRKKTRILCTHHPKFLGEASRVLVLNEGKIEQIGSPSKILSNLSNLPIHAEKSSESRYEVRPSIDAEAEERIKRRRLSSTAGNSLKIDLQIFICYRY